MSPAAEYTVRGVLLDRLQTFGQVRAIDEASKRVTVVVSTGDVARDEMIIDQAGWLFENYDRNPVVLWGHNDREMPVARAISSERVRTSNELIETHEFDAEDERAMLLFKKIKRGFVNATSVRWNPISWEWRKIDGQEYLVFTKQELLESSYVSIPADPGALIVRAQDMSPLDREQFRPHITPRESPLERLAEALESFRNKEN